MCITALFCKLYIYIYFRYVERGLEDIIVIVINDMNKKKVSFSILYFSISSCFV